MKEICGKDFVLNSVIKPAGLFDSSLVYKGDSVYEVIRMIKGVPVFFDDHMDRLSASLRLQGRKQLADRSMLGRDIISLARSDRKKEINIKIVFNYNENDENYLIYYIDSVYPSQEDYRKGVRGILFFAERKDPESKVINSRLKNSIHQELIQEDAYEAVLVNENNLVTEGSKSNIFFLKGNILVTAPDNVILKGITRKHILNICNKNKISVEFSCVDAENMPEYEAAFMTGTSPMVLPFCCINETRFNPGLPLMDKLRILYMQRAEDSLRSFITDNNIS